MCESKCSQVLYHDFQSSDIGLIHKVRIPVILSSIITRVCRYCPWCSWPLFWWFWMRSERRGGQDWSAPHQDHPRFRPKPPDSLFPNILLPPSTPLCPTSIADAQFSCLRTTQSVLMQTKNASSIRDVCQKKAGKCGNFEKTGGGLPKSHFFCNLTKCFLACQIHSEVLKHVL